MDEVTLREGTTIAFDRAGEGPPVIRHLDGQVHDVAPEAIGPVLVEFFGS